VASKGDEDRDWGGLADGYLLKFGGDRSHRDALRYNLRALYVRYASERPDAPPVKQPPLFPVEASVLSDDELRECAEHADAIVDSPEAQAAREAEWAALTPVERSSYAPKTAKARPKPKLRSSYPGFEHKVVDAAGVIVNTTSGPRKYLGAGTKVMEGHVSTKNLREGECFIRKPVLGWVPLESLGLQRFEFGPQPALRSIYPDVERKVVDAAGVLVNTTSGPKYLPAETTVMERHLCIGNLREGECYLVEPVEGWVPIESLGIPHEFVGFVRAHDRFIAEKRYEELVQVWRSNFTRISSHRRDI